jgi:hypothetical protein
MVPFGLYFRQVLKGPSPFPGMAQTTSEPEVTVPGDSEDREKIDAVWLPDEDEEDDDDDEQT